MKYSTQLLMASTSIYPIRSKECQPSDDTCETKRCTVGLRKVEREVGHQFKYVIAMLRVLSFMFCDWIYKHNETNQYAVRRTKKNTSSLAIINPMGGITTGTREAAALPLARRTHFSIL